MNNLNSLLDRVARRGVSQQQILAGSGVSAADIARRGFKPTVTQFRTVLSNIVALAPPGIGLSIGLDCNISHYGMFGYAALSSATLRDINRLAEQYHVLVDEFTEYANSEVNGEWRIQFATTYPLGDALPFLMEELFARTRTETSFYIGKEIQFKSLDLAYPEPSYGRLYREVFQCPIRFDRGKNQVVVDAKYLEHPVIFSNPEVCRLCEEQCAKILGESNQSHSLSTEIRRRLLLNSSGFPPLAEMAAGLGMNPAFVQRKLREERETYRGLLESIRKDLAIEYLHTTDLSAKEISYRLRFSNVHNFRRAFKAWTGRYPSHFQR